MSADIAIIIMIAADAPLSLLGSKRGERMSVCLALPENERDEKMWRKIK